MTNLQEQITNTINNFYTENQLRKILKNIMVKYDIEALSDFDSMSTPDLKNVILDFEQSGATGFDCGFTNLVILSKTKESKDIINKTINAIKKAKVYEFAGFSVNKYDLDNRKLKLYIDFPLPVQSTTINGIQLDPLIKKLQNELGAEYYVMNHTVLD